MAAWVLAAIVVVLYLPALDGQILDWDDGVWLNDPILDLGFADALKMALTETRDRAWYPVLRMSWWLQIQATGESVRAMHGVNLALFAGSIPGIVTLVRRCSVPAVPALIGVALWAVHPSRVESVAWLTSRKDVLALAFVVAAAHAFLPAEGEPRRDGLGTLLFVLAVLSKLAVAPLIAVIGRAIRAREGTSAALWATSVSVVAGLGIAAWGIVAFQDGAAVRPYPGLISNVGFGFWQVGSWTLRLGQITGRSVVHPLPGSLVPLGLLGLLVVLVVGAVTWIRREEPWVAVVGALALVPLLPMSGIVSMNHWAGDRHLLYPSLAVFVGLAVVADRLAKGGPARFAPMLLALPFVVGTSLRIPDWHDPIALWEADAARPGTHWVRGIQLGTAYGRASRFPEAVAAYREAEAAKPDEPMIVARRLIAELAADGEWSQADATASQTLQPEPDSARGWSTAAAALIDTKHFAGARDAANLAKTMGADDFGTHLVLATVAMVLGDEDPEPHLHAAAAHNPATVEQIREQVRAFTAQLR